MDRIKTITTNGKDIILIDLSKCSENETLQVIPEAKKVISALSPKSGLVVTDVTGAIYTKAVAEAIKSLVSHNTPYLKASSVVGADGVAAVLLQTVIFLTRRELKSCATREEAYNWLNNHP
jgi:hypothetical protein